MSSANNSILDASSSDDGGFLPKQNQQQQRLKSSWRRPLVGNSQLSLRSEGSGLSGAQAPHHHLTIVDWPPGQARFLASSPSQAPPPPPWASPSLLLGELSSVRPVNSTGGSGTGTHLPSSPPLAAIAAGYLQLRSVHQRYSQELPSLRAIHAEAQRFAAGSGQPLATSSPPQTGGRPRARLPPRHARHARSAPELANSPELETSPESRSSSSGFGSKNTSQQNQSSRSGSTVAEWRPPPYKAPPPPLSVGRWLELQQHEAAAAEGLKQLNLGPAVDAGSVDGHYEFDPVSCTPTPTSASTPTREERPPPVHQLHQLRQVHTAQPLSDGSQRQQVMMPSGRYTGEDVEARLQAMKAEFHQFRQRQAKRRRSTQLESAC